MDIIPVIDIKNGQIVHAHGGRRDEYRPIETPLSPTSDPVDVARGLLGLHPFQTLYIADLDAIEGRPANAAAIAGIYAAVPNVSLWIDNGIGASETASAWLRANPHSLVLGSESQRSARILTNLERRDRLILSLDYRLNAFQGPAEIEQAAPHWPDRVIAMTLARVGGAAGPDMDRVRSIVGHAAGRRVYAAGGVRNLDDLRRLKEIGAAGALIATALHNGGLTSEHLNEIAQPSRPGD